MQSDFSFFARGQAKPISEEEAELMGTPEALGQALITIFKLWIEHALKIMPPNRRIKLDLDSPNWLNLMIPEHAIHEFYRIAGQIPPYMPSKKIIDELTSDEKLAAEVMYRIRMLSDTLKEVNVPACQAILIIERSLILGARVAEAHVNPFESFAAIQYGAQTKLINHNRHSPPGSSNALRAEQSSREHENWIREAKSLWQLNKRLSANAVAKRIISTRSLPQKLDTVRKVISSSRPKL
jgi:hypothetical protein